MAMPVLLIELCLRRIAARRRKVEMSGVLDRCSRIHKRQPFVANTSIAIHKFKTAIDAYMQIIESIRGHYILFRFFYCYLLKCSHKNTTSLFSKSLYINSIIAYIYQDMFSHVYFLFYYLQYM